MFILLFYLFELFPHLTANVLIVVSDYTLKLTIRLRSKYIIVCGPFLYLTV